MRAERMSGRVAQFLRDHGGLAGCLLAALAVAVYLPALGGRFLYDDAMYVTADSRLGTLGGLGRIWTEISGPNYLHQYYPLTTSAFWLQYAVWGDNPVGYHAVNILLHALNAVLLWRLLRALAVPGAWLAAAIFAVHPVNVPSVAWIAELKNVLSGAFFLASMLVFVRWLGLDGRDPRPGGAAPRPRRRGLYALGTVLLVAALLSKTATGLLPAALLIVVWWKRWGGPGIDAEARGVARRGGGRGGVWRDVAAIAPLAVLAAGFMFLTSRLEAGHGAQGEAFSLSLAQRGMVAGRALWFYASKIAWPAGLSIMYPRWTITATMAIFPLAAAAVLAALWGLRGRLGRGAPAAAAYYVVAVVPVCFVNVAFQQYSFVADHWLYWASMGLIAGLAAGGVTLARRRARGDAQLAAAAIPAVLVVAALGALTWQRAHVFESPVTLWRDAAARNPGSRLVRYNLGAALLDDGATAEAIAEFSEAIRIDPADAMSHNNLGVSLRSQGRLTEAIGHFQRAIALEPDFELAHANLGGVLLALGRWREAQTCFERALEIDPDFAGAHGSLGAILEAHGRPEAAAAHYRRALELRLASDGRDRVRRRGGDRAAATGQTLAGAAAGAKEEGDFGR